MTGKPDWLFAYIARRRIFRSATAPRRRADAHAGRLRRP